ncbi:MAG: AtpZ/AtpI family protein [Rhodothalassiaceae bacterium]
MGHDDESDQSDQFKRRLQAARASLGRDDPKRDRRGTETNAAYKLSLELVSGVLVGAFLGFWIDRWLGTAPWALMALVLAGFAAGVRNLLRATDPAQSAARRQAHKTGTDDE